jgi:type II secretory pathway pseudopilin PulG
MRSGERGFTYLTVLFFIALLGLALAGTGEVWSTARQREKEAELIWIGNQFIQAIGLYYQRSPGAVKRYPEKLEDLLQDHRYLVTQRYLRRIYRDPMTEKPEWGLIRAPDGGVMGVYSLSSAAAIRKLTATAEAGDEDGHRAWRFVYVPPQRQ